MNRIPPELLLKILDYFEFDELIKIGFTCLRFKNIIDYIIKNKLIWFSDLNSDQNYKSKFLFGTNEFVSSNLNCLLAYSSIKFNLRTDLPSKITKLIIQNPYLLHNFNFDNLIYLEVINHSFTTPSEQKDALTIFLNLPKLIYLKLDLSLMNNEDEFKMFIDTPLLTHLWINDILDFCQFMNLRTSKNLQNLYFNTIDECYYSLKIFDNLTDLTFDDYDDEMYPGNLVRDNKFLKRLNFFSIDEDSLNSIKESRSNAKRYDLKIYYKNIDTDVVDYDTINSIDKDDLTTNNMNVYKKYSDYLYDNYFDEYKTATINIDKIPFYILKKFKYLTKLEINSPIKHIRKWSRLMKIFKLKSIDFTCAIQQEYLNLITNQNSTLESLSIRDDGENLDLNFILKLFNLKVLVIYDRILDIELFRSLIKKLRFLNSITFLDRFKINLESSYESDDICCIYDSKIVYKENKKIFQTATINNLRSITQLYCVHIPTSF